MAWYRVEWNINLEADSALEAVQEALAIHRDPESIATEFEVAECDENGDLPAGAEFESIDLGFGDQTCQLPRIRQTRRRS